MWPIGPQTRHCFKSSKSYFDLVWGESHSISPREMFPHRLKTQAQGEMGVAKPTPKVMTMDQILLFMISGLWAFGLGPCGSPRPSQPVFLFSELSLSTGQTHSSDFNLLMCWSVVKLRTNMTPRKAMVKGFVSNHNPLIHLLA